MKKVVVCILVMLFSICSYGQKLPSIAPVSPEAANIGKYGDIPVNLSTGKINYNIPLFTIKEGGFELPIYLSYNHSGLLAEETPGITGLGWTLHSGGRITRELRGRADEEHSYGYIGGNVGLDLVVPFLNGTFRSDLTNDQRKNARITFLERVNENKYDTQPDKYNINGGGLSGSFTYNEYGFEKENVVFLNQKNYEIDRDVNNNSFDIKDDKGIDYSFNKTENSVSEDFFISEKTPIYYTSSWLLSEVNLPNSSSKINFEYFNDLEGYSNSFVIENQSTGCGPTKNTNVDIIATSSQKLVSKIIFPNGYITFKVNKTSSTSKSKIGYYLNEISIFNNLDKRIKKYEFVYDNLNSNLRLLQEIKLYDRADQIIPFYSFEYYGSSMPLELNAKSQDLWGYYNNTNNTSLINGNRRLDFNSTVLGALKEIKYPTGGSTKLEYEQNATNFTETDNLSLLEASNCSLYSYNQQITLSSTSGRKTKRILFDSDQLIKVTLLTRTSGNGIASSNGGFRKISGPGDLHCGILSKCNSNCEKSITTESELGNSTGNIHVSSFFSIKKGDELELFVDVFSSNASSFANVIIDYYGKEEAKEEANVDFFVPVGGLRIKKTSDCFKSGECIEKEYKYSPGLMLSNPNYSYTTKDDDGCLIKNVSTKSKTSISSYQGISVFYNQVEIHNNKDNGKQINYYSYNRNNSGTFPFAPVENKDWRKGNLIKQKIYKQDNNDYKLVKKVENIYSSFDLNFISTGNNKSHSTGLTVGQFAPYPKIVSPTQGTLTLPTESVYKKITTFINPEYYHLTSTTSTDYL